MVKFSISQNYITITIKGRLLLTLYVSLGDDTVIHLYKCSANKNHYDYLNFFSPTESKRHLTLVVSLRVRKCIQHSEFPFSTKLGPFNNIVLFWLGENKKKTRCHVGRVWCLSYHRKNYESEARTIMLRGRCYLLHRIPSCSLVVPTSDTRSTGR